MTSKLSKPLSFVFYCILIIIMVTSCRDNATPRPYGYFRIDLPAKEYALYKSDCSFSFEYPVYGNIVPYEGENAEPCWMNIEFPGYKGTIYLTYKTMEDNLSAYSEDIRTLAYKHIIKADDIIEKPFYYPDKKVYGIIYDIRGNTASSVNFFVTDSTDNFLSGALYFNVQPNKDSLAPVINFFKEDIDHIIETFKWN